MDITLAQWVKRIVTLAAQHPNLARGTYSQTTSNTDIALDLDTGCVTYIKDGETVSQYKGRETFRTLFNSVESEEPISTLTVFAISDPRFVGTLRYRGSLHGDGVLFHDSGYTYGGKVFYYFGGRPEECLPCIIEIGKTITLLGVALDYQLALQAVTKLMRGCCNERTLTVGDLTFRRSTNNSSIIVSVGADEVCLKLNLST